MPFFNYAGRAAVVIMLFSGSGRALAAAPELPKARVDPQAERTQQIDTLEHQDAADRATVHAQSGMIRSMSGQQVALMERMKSVEGVVRSQQQLIEKMEADNLSAAVYQNTLATVLNIFGMVLGVIGGTLLAGAQLTSRQERISTLKQLPPIVDLATRNTQYEPVLNFFAILGSITLSLGFVLQLVGALIASPLSIVTMVVIGLIAIVSSTWIFWFFLGQTHAQTRGEKLVTIQQNIRKNVLQPFAQYFVGRGAATCEVCCRKLSANDAEVWWLAEHNSPEHPYLHAPYGLHYGHSACLPRCEDYALYYAQPHRYANHEFYRVSAETFIRDAAPELRSRYNQQRDYWARMTNNANFDTPHEAHLSRVENAISPLVQSRTRP